mgnify:CR=1 FL=1
MNTIKFFILLGLMSFNFNFAKAKGIPYCTKKITRGCIKGKRGQTAKYYFAPKYNERKSLVDAKSKKYAKKLTKNTKHKKIKKEKKRSTASALDMKVKLKKAKKKNKN